MQVRFLPGLHRREARRESGGFFCAPPLGLFPRVPGLAGFLELGFELANPGAELGRFVLVAGRFVGFGIEFLAVALLRPKIVNGVQGHAAHGKQADFVLPWVQGRKGKTQHEECEEQGSKSQQQAFK